MSVVGAKITELAKLYEDSGPSSEFGPRLANALLWTNGAAHVEELSPKGFPAGVTRAYLGNQPAAMFVSHSGPSSESLLNEAALLAYHGSVEWGIITNAVTTTIFNSQWIRNSNWF